MGEIDVGLRESHKVSAVSGTPTLVIRNGFIVDVITGGIFESNVEVFDDKIVGLTKEERSSRLVVDARGGYVIPGFIDSHIHIESTMLIPQELSRILIPHGVTTLMADPHEIANVLGLKGIELLVEMSRSSKVRVFIQVPSRVPTAPGLETTGGELGEKEIEILLERDYAVSLGELNYQNVLRDPAYVNRINISRRYRKRSNGHMAGVLEEELLNMLASTGLTDDHEAVSAEEAFRRLIRGIAVFVREGSSERNLADVLKGLRNKIRDYRLLMFCSDDKHPTDILREGHIDYNVRKAIELGLDPLVAIQMATINPAIYFRVDDLIGSITPGRKADLVVVDSLEKLNIRTVVFNGEVVYHEGRLLFDSPQINLPEWAVRTIRLNPGLKQDDLLLKTSIAEGRALVRVIEITPGQILKRELLEWLKVENGLVLSDLNRDILHIAIVERHKGLLNVGKAFVKGFKLRKGAIASSVSHDHHNIAVIGVDALDMYIAVKRLSEINGGFVAVSEGRIVGEIPLEFAGLMSIRRYEEVVEDLTRLNNAVRSVLGSELSNPFMQLEFVSLPSVPELGLTDRGLVKDYKIVEPIIEVSS